MQTSPAEAGEFDLQRVQERIENALLQNEPEVLDVSRIAPLQILIEKGQDGCFDVWLQAQVHPVMSVHFDPMKRFVQRRVSILNFVPEVLRLLLVRAKCLDRLYEAPVAAVYEGLKLALCRHDSE